MSSVKVHGLLMTLIQRTEDKKISWEVTAWSNKYIAALANYSVGIAEEGEGRDYHLTIENEYDEVIEIVSDDDLNEYDYKSTQHMRGLYNMARRSARGADKAIDDILGFLE